MPTKILKEIVEFLGKKLDAIAKAKFQSSVTVQAKFPEIQKVKLEGVDVVTLKGEPGETPTKDHLVSLIRPLIPTPMKGDDGHTPSKQELMEIIQPLIPEPIRGQDGHTPSEQELKGIIIPLIPKPLAGSSDTGEDIIQKINENESDRLIRKEKVEGLEELESAIKTADANQRSWSNSGSFVYAQDISASLNGSTKTFTLVANAKVVMVFGSSAPGVFRPTVDYTTTGSTITFTSEITAASTLAAGQTVIILYKLV